MDKILVIDDSPVQAEFLKSILQGKYEVTECQTAREGLNAALTGAYTLILLDVIMPDMDGFAVLRKLKEAMVTQHIPVILITGLADVQSEEKGLTMGAVDYIGKPFSPVIVKARVNTHIKLYQYSNRFQEQTKVDVLTGAASRSCYEELSIERWQEAMRLGVSFSVCILDLDRFKAYNTAYGHAEGDQVIATVAQTVAGHLKRCTDFFARYDGEKFVVITLGEEAGKIYRHMKRIRQAVEDLQIPSGGPDSRWLTVSVGGVTVTPRDGEFYDTCLKTADTMLREAKRLGRNQVVWSNDGKGQWQER